MKGNDMNVEPAPLTADERRIVDCAERDFIWHLNSLDSLSPEWDELVERKPRDERVLSTKLGLLFLTDRAAAIAEIEREGIDIPVAFAVRIVDAIEKGNYDQAAIFAGTAAGRWPDRPEFPLLRVVILLERDRFDRGDGFLCAAGAIFDGIPPESRKDGRFLRSLRYLAEKRLLAAQGAAGEDAPDEPKRENSFELIVHEGEELPFGGETKRMVFARLASGQALAPVTDAERELLLSWMRKTEKDDVETFAAANELAEADGDVFLRIANLETFDADAGPKNDFSSSHAAFLLSKCYRCGAGGFARSDAKAWRWLEQAARRSNSCRAAIRDYGLALQRGLGCREANESDAELFLDCASDYSNPDPAV